MKRKAYISPELHVVLMETQKMIAASDSDTMNVTVSGDEINSGWADSRRGRSIWDDDEE